LKELCWLIHTTFSSYSIANCRLGRHLSSQYRDFRRENIQAG
jgi:hypothetical protein